MALVEVSCPRCHAPVEAPANASVLVKCRFCGSSLRDPNAPAARTVTVPTVVIERRVGPSNKARAWDVLTKVGGMPADEAERVIRSAPCDACVLEPWDRAEELALALRQAGLDARVEGREVVVPPPIVLPDCSVHLEAVGEDKVAVMKVVREHIDCGLVEAKALVARAPCVLAGNLGGARAAAFEEALKAAGATVRLDRPQ
jgi:hypothetical protein